MRRLLFCLGICLMTSLSSAAEFAITMDDPEVSPSPLLTPSERDERILAALSKHQTRAALFVCGMRVDNVEGKHLLQAWNNDKHILANHSYHHKNFNDLEISLDSVIADSKKAEKIIADYQQFSKFYRFPYLKEGNSLKKRDGMRAFLDAQNYRNGHVSIDASDWYVDARMRNKLERNAKLDLKPYRDFYLKHMWDRAQYYDSLAKSRAHPAYSSQPTQRLVSG